MPKNKKRKLNNHNHHHHNQSTSQDITHEEIWDDSALIRSWNDAVAEYEFYHSIHAKGEDVDEVLRRAEMEEQESGEARRDEQEVVDVNGVHVNVGHEGEAEEGEVDDVTQTTGTLPIEDDVPVRIGPPLPPTIKASSAALTGSAGPAPATTAPLGVEAQLPKTAGTSAASSSADQTLENIKMAYYWAGYYSGLYDAQRQRGT
ncbi:hypothetical protein LTR64_006815 [Lithohypha guttulata]|uniref:uncharacterized protein n=1 Tax=Lithohypha guttulata TaxID=1690604 RepID=UPI002DDDCFE7|nr:hypothetical protein LTR51_004627 [Lithohypha guttulata]